jgi:undecaprenyl diphosphate synthase
MLTSAHYVAIISDGSARWARARGLSVAAGHEAAADAVIRCVGDAIALGIAELTIYSFSTENWSRPAREVRGLLALLGKRIARDSPLLAGQGARIRFIGRPAGVPGELLAEMRRAEELTALNEVIDLYIAFNYGGRAEIVDAAARFDGSGADEAAFRALLYAPGMHDPDIIIRTGRERRLSNYLLWQGAYSELVFRDELWPDFDRWALERSLAEFEGRGRRFGGR